MQHADAYVSFKVGHPTGNYSTTVHGGSSPLFIFPERSERVRRPETGSAIVEVRCVRCDASVPLRVSSLRSIRKMRWLSAALAMAGIVTFSVLFYISGDPPPATENLSPEDSARLIVAIAAWVAVGAGVVGVGAQNGVRTRYRLYAEDKHAVQPD